MPKEEFTALVLQLREEFSTSDLGIINYHQKLDNLVTDFIYTV